jgi:hypothetical protein
MDLSLWGEAVPNWPAGVGTVATAGLTVYSYMNVGYQVALRNRSVGFLRADQGRAGKTPCSAMIKVKQRYGDMLLCGKLLPATLVAAGLICLFGVAVE